MTSNQESNSHWSISTRHETGRPTRTFIVHSVGAEEVERIEVDLAEVAILVKATMPVAARIAAQARRDTYANAGR